MLAGACAVVAGDSSGAASNYPSPLNLTSTPSTLLSSSWKMDSTSGTQNMTTATGSASISGPDGAWYTFAPGVTNVTRQTSMPTSPDGHGFLVDPAGGASGFPAGNWVFTVKTSIPGTPSPGVAYLTVGMWTGSVVGGAFVPSATILAPTDDTAHQDLRSAAVTTTSVTYPLPKFALAAGETLYVELWRHQIDGIPDLLGPSRELDLVVNDGSSRITHPAADGTPPTHALSVTTLTGRSIFNLPTSTVYYDGGHNGSFKVGDTLVDSGSGPFQVTYPDVATTGWLHPAEAVISGGSFSSGTYGWTAGSTTAPAPQTITGEDNARQTSTTTLNFVNDSTGPTGDSVTVNGGPDFATASVPLTLTGGADAGVGPDPNSGIVERATGTPNSGTCGSFGSFAAIPISSGVDSSVVDGSCYHYRYTVSDLLGNSTTSANSVDAIVDMTAPTVSATQPTAGTGSSDQYWNGSTNTLWFRPNAAGSFTLNASATDAQSGATRVTFPDVSATTGWTGSTGGTDSGQAPYVSPTAYSWTSGATAPGAKTLTVTNGSGLTATGAVTFSSDSTAPTGQTISLSGGPWYTSTSVPLTTGPGTDAGSGIDASRTVVQRASATLANGTCGTFGSFATITLSSGADPNVTTANCYRYEFQATDNVGNVSAVSAASGDAKVDTTAPAAPTLLFTALSSASATGTIVYYNPAAPGSFTVTASSSDAESSVTSYSFPTIPGFTALGAGPTRTYTFANNPSAPLAPATVTATNGAGQIGPAASFTLVPDPTPPTLTVLCDGKPCLTTAYPKAVDVSITATDGTGSGLDTIHYTTDGTSPTVDKGNDYAHDLVLSDLTHLKVQAYDKVGNASTLVSLTVNSLANKLVFAAPLRVVIRAKGQYLQAKVSASKRVSVVAMMRGTGLKIAQRWRFTLDSGASIVQLKLPKAIKRPGTYRVTWTVTSGTKKAVKLTTVALRA